MRGAMRVAASAYLALTLAIHIAAAPAYDAPGMVIVDRGAAAFYASSWDDGGWDAMIRKRIAWGQHDPKTFPYSDDGYYCVRPGFVFGNILTITNAQTGKTILCTVADETAPGDRRLWFSRWVVELSYVAYEDLGLDDGNDVIVSAMQHG